DRRERRKWILRARRSKGIRERYAEQRNRRTEWSILDEIVVEARKRLDVEHAPTSANGRDMFAGDRRPGSAQPRREISEVGGNACARKAGVAGENQAGWRVGE